MDSREFISHCERVCLKGGRENQWAFLDDLKINLYYRITKRLLAGSYHDTLEIGSVSVEPEFRGRGNFSTIILMVEDLAQRTGRAVMIESVLSDRIACLAKGRGYDEIPGETPSYYKVFGGTHEHVSD